MKIDKEITHVEIVDSVEKLNQKLESGYVLIEVLKRRDRDYDGFIDSIQYVVGR